MARPAQNVWELACDLCAASRWSLKGVLKRVYATLASERLADMGVCALDSTAVKVHPRRAWSAQKNGIQAIGKSRGGWNTKIHAVTAGDRRAAGLELSAGNVADAEAGRLLLESVGPLEQRADLLMDRAYEDGKTRLAAWGLRFNPVVPPKKNGVKPWDYGWELYKRRNEMERFFRRLKAFRCVCTRYDKLDRMFISFNVSSRKRIKQEQVKPCLR